MSIISSSETQIQVASGYQLNILQSSSIKCQINNLIINLTFGSLSSGSINLVYHQQVELSIKGYQIFGSYYSINTVALVAQIVKISNVTISSVVINTTVFTVGNASSLMFSKITSSHIKIQSVMMSIGTVVNPNKIEAIATSQSNYMQYGGFISFTELSQIIILDITVQQNDIWQTQYVFGSGQLIGQISGNTSVANVKHLCILYSFDSFNTRVQQFGIIGIIAGKCSAISVQIMYQILNGIFNMCGTFGLTENQSNVLLSNFNVQFTMGNSNNDQVSALVGSLTASQWQINKILINNSCLYGIKTGLVSGLAQNSGEMHNIIIIQSNTFSNGTVYHAFSGTVMGYIGSNTEIFVNQLSITSSTIEVFSVDQWNSHAGSIVGELQSYTSVTIQNIQIQGVNIVTNSNISVSYAGGFVGKSFINNNLTIQSSSITNSNISASQNQNSNAYSGGYVGLQGYAILNIFDSNCQNVYVQCKAQSESWAGGLVGQLLASKLFQLNNVVISNITISSQASTMTAKIVANYVSGTLQITKSQSTGTNTINSVNMLNCLDITNINSQSGC
ncbi:Hypothetical_protein [Hexamita inflata]|uniref:Hypothetical_protein n=1 Tax=Hexamita inflata TaxID=28002 RepID=A0AA86QI67_9EUKA|nr:Hypothetical protein HINF_LOCUS41347 [Hexamita inflata]CAI9953704.1 Hypothetical protein HINF_LOCUS41349 [Hexamita inflata]